MSQRQALRNPRQSLPSARLELSVAVRRPCARLAPFIDHIWLSRNATAPTTTLLPDGRIDVVLAYTPAGATVGVYGSVTAPATIALATGATYIGIQFRPGAARHVLAVPADALTDAALPANDALALSLDGALEADDTNDTIVALETALLRHLGTVQPRVDRIDHLVRALQDAEGRIRIAELTRRFGVSRRQVEREFLRTVGLPPKTFASIVRFASAAAALRRGSPIVEAAIAGGYADQSHLHREFQRFGGVTPSAYAQGRVAFLQDAKTVVGQDPVLPRR